MSAAVNLGSVRGILRQARGYVIGNGGINAPIAGAVFQQAPGSGYLRPGNL
jgi:hypothetical protein